QGYDPRWNATLEDGTDLGQPVVVNGYATGWFVDDLDAHTVSIGYGPQRRANVAMALSGVGLLVAGVIFLAPLVRRRIVRLREERDDEWDGDVAKTPVSPQDDAFLMGDVAGDDPFRPVGPQGTGGQDERARPALRPVTRGLAEFLTD